MDHSFCAPRDHDRYPAANRDEEDARTLDTEGRMICPDCGAPLVFCFSHGYYDHADPNTPVCSMDW
jgi:hypothetical protein